MKPSSAVRRVGTGTSLGNASVGANHVAAPPTATAAIAASPAVHHLRRSPLREPRSPSGDARSLASRATSCVASSRLLPASPMSRRRCRTSFWRQRRRRPCTARGTVGGRLVQSGSRSITAATTSAVVSPTNARRPASISYSTHPKAQMSDRLSTAFPRACSGLMYGAVPRIAPSSVAPAVIDAACVSSFASIGARSDPNAFAKPKSSTFTMPSGVILMFAGFRSR